MATPRRCSISARCSSCPPNKGASKRLSSKTRVVMSRSSAMEPDLEPATSRALARELKEMQLLRCRYGMGESVASRDEYGPKGCLIQLHQWSRSPCPQYHVPRRQYTRFADRVNARSADPDDGRVSPAE